MRGVIGSALTGVLVVVTGCAGSPGAAIAARATEQASIADAEDPGANSELPAVPQGVSSVDDYVEHLEDGGFAGALLVARDGHVTATEALGPANRQTGGPLITESGS